jgi:hypothetical protein
VFWDRRFTNNIKQLCKRVMESIVFNYWEVWRFQGKTKILAVEMGFGDILQQYKVKTGFKIK